MDVESIDDGLSPVEKAPQFKVDDAMRGYVPVMDPRLLALPWHPVVFRIMDANKDLYLYGEAGCGKDKAVMMWAAKRGVPQLPVSLHSKVTFTELLGKPNLKDGSTGFTEGLLLKFLQIPSVISFEEVNMVEPGGLAQFHQFLEQGKMFVADADDGRGRVYERHPECRLVVSANPSTARYGGTFRVNTALADRFHVFHTPAFTKEQIGRVMQGYGVDGRLINFAMQFYSEAREMIERDRMRCEVSVRSMVDFAELVMAGVDAGAAMEIAACNKALVTAGKEVSGALEKLWRAVCERTTTGDSVSTS
jgi:nitric oxide reductase NorQ protein